MEKRKISFDLKTDAVHYIGTGTFFHLVHKNGAQFIIVSPGGEHQKIARALQLKDGEKVRVTLEVIK